MMHQMRADLPPLPWRIGSIDSGMEFLRSMAQKQSTEASAQLENHYARMLPLLPS